ncbi:MAG: mannosyltransferase family protein [Candidatus Parvarchaeota archaeon]
MIKLKINLKEKNKYDFFQIVLIYTSYLLVVLTALWIGFYFLQHGLFLEKTSDIFDKLINWDANWYKSIAINGYEFGKDYIVKQYNIAFFPLYPLIERLMYTIFHNWNNVYMILPSFFFGFLSIILFYKLVDLLFEKRETVFISTIAYALYPASMFFLSGYPVSIINLLTIITLILLLKKRYWASAFIAGLNTASGPLPFFLSIVVCIAYIIDINNQNKLRYENNSPYNLLNFRNILYLFVFLIVSFSGILCFTIYQYFVFGNPLDFIRAQDAWGSLSKKQHLINIINLYSIYGGDKLSRSGFLLSLSFSTVIQELRNNIQFGFEWTVNGLNLILMAYLTWKQRKIKKWFFTLFGLLIISFYILLHGSVMGPNDTLRLLYLDIPAFIGVGVIYEENPPFSFFIILLFSILLFLQTAFFVGGYWIN